MSGRHEIKFVWYVSCLVFRNSRQKDRLVTKMKNKFLILISVFLLIGPLTANADPIVVDGELVGATNVNVDGTLYDVFFDDGPCVVLFSGCDETSDFEFQTLAAALLAAEALLNQVFLDGAFLFDSVPSLTSGCEIDDCAIETPYDFTGSIVTAVTRNRILDVGPPSMIDGFGPSALTGPANDLNPGFVWAVWSQSDDDPPVSVPEPGTLALLTIGLVGMRFARRRRKV